MRSDDTDPGAPTSMFDEHPPAARVAAPVDGRTSEGTVYAPPALVPRVARRWRVIAAAGLVCAVLGALVGVVAPTHYRAEALVQLGPGASDLVTGTPDPQQDLDRRVATETQILTSERVRTAAESAVERDLPDVEVTQESSSDLLAVAVTTDDPDAAAEDAEAYVEAYLQLTSERTRAQLDPAIDVLKTRNDGIKSSLGDLRRLIEAVPEAESDTPATDALLAQQTDLLEQRRDTKTTIDRLEGAAAIGNLDVRSFADAEPPSSPSTPPPWRLALLALLVGLVAGSVLAAAVPLGTRLPRR